MSGRLIAIGDIHGCSTALSRLLEALGPSSTDTIVTLGDYVDRGPDSRGVIEQLIDLKTKCQLVALLGNHEEMMLEVIRDGQPHMRWLQYGGVETLDSFGFIGDLSVFGAEHHRFFDELVDFYETEQHLFLHANYQADRPLAELDPYTLRWLKLTQQTPQAHVSGKRAILGHTHDPGGEIFDLGHLICIDTYCYGGGWLTALDADTGHVWQTNQAGELRESPARSG